MSKVHETLSPGTYENMPASQEPFIQAVLSDSYREVDQRELEETEGIIVDTVAKMYWKAALALIEKASLYIRNEKLLMNYKNPATRYAVKAAVEKREDFSARGTMGLLDYRNKLRREYYELVDRFNASCLQRGFPQLNGDILLGILSASEVNSRIIEKVRRRIKIHIEISDPPFPLTDLPKKEIRGYVGI